MKQSSVEWLVEQYTNENYGIEVYEQAKEMHKAEIFDAYICGEHQQGFQGEAEQYYNDTFTK